MTLGRTLLIAALLLTGCAENPVRPVITGHAKDVSPQDIQLAIRLVRERCISDGRGLLPIFHVYVHEGFSIFVHCGPHYGAEDAAGALTFLVERVEGKWRITEMSQYKPDPERAIVT